MESTCATRITKPPPAGRRPKQSPAESSAPGGSRAGVTGEFGAEFRFGFQPVLHVAALRPAESDPPLVGPHRDFVVRQLHLSRGRLGNGRRDGSGHGSPSLK